MFNLCLFHQFLNLWVLQKKKLQRNIELYCKQLKGILSNDEKENTYKCGSPLFTEKHSICGLVKISAKSLSLTIPDFDTLESNEDDHDFKFFHTLDIDVLNPETNTCI